MGGPTGKVTDFLRSFNAKSYDYGYIENYGLLKPILYLWNSSNWLLLTGSIETMLSEGKSG